MDYNKIRIISFKQQYKPNDVNKEVWISFKQGGVYVHKDEEFYRSVFMVIFCFYDSGSVS